MRGRLSTLGVATLCAAVLTGIGVASSESGYQVINGTRVFTEIDHNRGVATFSNSCGRQTLTQRQLQGGAIPDQIIPCPHASENRVNAS